MATERLRRQRGSGSVFQKLPCKNWVLQFYRDGKRIREATGSPDHDAAKKLLRQRLREIDIHEYQEHSGRPMRIADLYANLQLVNQMKQRDGADHAGRWRHLEPAFGATVAAKLTSDRIMAYVVARQAEGAASATINRELAALKRMFRLGLESTPPKVLRVPHIPMLTENNVRKGFVEDAGFALLAAEASELWLRVLLELAFTYGWRRGELLKLRVRQVNLAQGTIRLDPGTTKNRQGREVAMTASVRELLAAAVHSKRPDDAVLTRAGGVPVRSIRNAWQRMCCRAGLGTMVCVMCQTAECACLRPKRQYRGLILHDLRRSAAKALRRAGVAESVIMATGGWKTSAMFVRYAIVSSADQRAAVEMLERARTLAPGSAPIAPEEPKLDKAKIQ